MEKETDQSVSLYAILMCLLCALFYSYQYMVRVAPGQCIDVILSDLNLDAAFAGKLSAIYLTGYSLAQIPVAMIANKFGPKKASLLGLSIVVFANFLQYYAQCQSGILFTRALVGFGSAFAMLCTLQMCQVWLHPNYAGRSLGFVVILGMLGIGISQYLVGYLLYIGVLWRELSVILGLLGVALAVSYVLFLDDKGPYSIARDDSSSEAFSITEFLTLSFAINCIYSWLSYAPLVVMDYWAGKIASDLGSGNIQSALTFGLIIGLSGAGYLADRFGFKRTIIAGGTVSGGLCMLTYVIPIEYYTPLFFIIGMSAATSPLPIGFSAMLISASQSGTARGVTNLTQMIGAAITTTAIGTYIASGSYTIVNDTRVYDLATYQSIFAIIGMSIIAGTVLMCFVKSTAK